MTRRKQGQSLPVTLGGIVVGFEQQVWRTAPPPHELVRKGQPLRAVGADGTDVTIELPPAYDPWPAPEAVLLDLDGLAIDSEPIHMESTRRALADFGVGFELAAIVEFFGQPTRATCDFLAERHGLDPEELWERRAARFEELTAGGIPFRPGLVEGIGELRAVGLGVGIVSSGLRRYVSRSVETMVGAGLTLDVVVAREDVEQPKPHPEPYLRGAAALGLPPGACVVFEDAPAGLLAAVAAGMRCVVVPNEHTADGDFDAASAVLPDLLAAARWVLARVPAAP